MISGIETIGKKIPVRKKPGKKINKNDKANAADWVRMNTPTMIPILRMANIKIAESPKKAKKFPLNGTLNQRIARTGIRAPPKDTGTFSQIKFQSSRWV